MEIVMFVPMSLLFVAFVASFYRLVKGPSAVDRILCLDFLALLIGAFIAFHAVVVGEPVYLDAVLLLSIIAFLGTVVFARYIEWRAQ